MPNSSYEGQVKVYDKKANGDPLIIGKGDRQGEPYFKLSFKEAGEYVNLMDFDGVTGGQSGAYHVEYHQKFLPNGDPDLYNGKPQYQLDSIYALGGAPATQQAHSAAPVAQAGGMSKEDLSAYQTSLNCAVTYYAAGIKAGLLISMPDLNLITMAATFFHTYLTTGKVPNEPNELDAMMDAAKAGLTGPDDDIPFG